MPFVLMKIFEESPRRYDRWMHLITLGRLERVRRRIAERLVPAGAAVLELGSGTGVLMARLARGGARVEGVDVSAEMIDEARRRLTRDGLGDRARVRRCHALSVEDEFEAASFDRVVAVLMLSELYEDEVDCLLRQCGELLRPEGRLIVADEVRPDRLGWRLLASGWRGGCRLLTYLGQQAVDLRRTNFALKILYFVIELPLMLVAFFVAPPATRPLRDLDGRLAAAGFRIGESRDYLGGSLRLLVAEPAFVAPRTKEAQVSAAGRVAPSR